MKYLGDSIIHIIVGITHSNNCLAKSIRVLFFGNIQENLFRVFIPPLKRPYILFGKRFRHLFFRCFLCNTNFPGSPFLQKRIANIQAFPQLTKHFYNTKQQLFSRKVLTESFREYLGELSNRIFQQGSPFFQKRMVNIQAIQ